MEHNSENLVVSVFLLYLVIVSDCSFRIWLDEIRGEGRESFGDNFWAASKKFSGRVAPGALGAPGARAARMRGGGGGGGAAVGRAESSERWRAGVGSLAGAGWGHVQAGARRGGLREQRVGCIE